MSNEIMSKAKQYIELEEHDLFKHEIEELVTKDDTAELNERFYTDLAFGTGGLRGIIGGGFNRMNPYVVRRATQGLANYIRAHSMSKDPSIVIAFDSRNYSDLFAKEAALVMAGNGVKAYLFSSLRPTPELSFAVRHLGATSGIVITASHNPPEYNGYKVYWSDGGQIISPHDTGIIEEVRKVTTDIKVLTESEAVKTGLLEIIDKEVDEAFYKMVDRQILRKDVLLENGKDVKVVFTPLHGTGAVPVKKILNDLGVTVIMVPEQEQPDGNFPTVDYPNPEEASALKMAVDLAKKEKAHLVMGTDPDADRLGIAVPDGNDFVLITGNQLGTLLADYLFSGRKELGKLPDKIAFVKTIVTTNLQKKLAESYGAECHDVLTGFKYIADKIKQFEAQTDGPEYIFGGEESYGYLASKEVRDKDAVAAAVLTAEMTIYHVSRGKSVLQRLNEIYQEYGYYQETLISGTFKGQEGLKRIQALMDKLRTETPEKIAGIKVISVKDYLTGNTLDMATGSKKGDINLPSSNVLQFILEDESVISARPSGTEPKIKFYASCTAPCVPDLATARSGVAEKLQKIEADINGWLS